MINFEETENGLCLNVIIYAQLGLHARPAAKLAQELQKFDADIEVHCGQNKADAKSVLDLLTLGATNGSELFFYAKGQDAKLCLKHVVKFFSADFQN